MLFLMNYWRKYARICITLIVTLFRVEWMNFVHYPYARTNGASHRRVVVARVSRLRTDRHLLHVIIHRVY